MLDRLDPKKEGVGVTRLRRNLTWNGDRVGKVIARLEREGIIEHVEIQAKIGNGAQRAAPGIRRQTVTARSGDAEGILPVRTPEDEGSV